MIFRVSNTSTRVVGRLDAGEDLVDRLSDVCADQGVSAGEIRAVGHFDAIELVHFNGATQSYETIVDGEGSFDLVSLSGNISRLGGEVALQIKAVFNVVGPLGPQMVGGQLRRARATSAEFIIDSFGDLNIERRLDSSTGRLLIDSIERTAKAPAAAPVAETSSPQEAQEEAEPSISWDQAIEEVDRTDEKRQKRKRSGPASALKKQPKDDPYASYDPDEPLMAQGDILKHPKLGRCSVIDVEDDQYARIRLPRGRMRKLALAILEVEYEGKEDGKNVFAARVKR